MIISNGVVCLSKIVVKQSQVEAYKTLIELGETEEKMLMFIDRETLNAIKKVALKK